MWAVEGTPNHTPLQGQDRLSAAGKHSTLAAADHGFRAVQRGPQTRSRWPPRQGAASSRQLEFRAKEIIDDDCDSEPGRDPDDE
jgi:hypothetical protein